MSANLVDYDADIIDNTTLSEPDYVDKPPPWETAATAQIAGVRTTFPHSNLPIPTRQSQRWPPRPALGHAAAHREAARTTERAASRLHAPHRTIAAAAAANTAATNTNTDTH